MTTVVISQPMLFPWPGMMEHIAQADIFIHRDDADFSKSNRTHRIQVKTQKGAEWMTIPIAHHCYERPIKDLEAGSNEWRGKHINLLRNAYAKAPQLGRMIDLVEQVYKNDGRPLVEVIADSQTALAEALGVWNPKEVLKASEMTFKGERTEQLVDIVKQVGGDVYLTGHGAKNYMDHEMFERAGIEVRYVTYSLSEYPQLHGEFTPYVSALDLIANTGDGASTYLKRESVNWREFVGAGE